MGVCFLCPYVIYKMADETQESDGNLFDRVAVGVLSALLAVLTALIIPLMFLMSGVIVPWVKIYLYGSLVFAFIMFAIGFLLKVNLLSHIYGKIWHALYRVFVHD